MDRTMCGLAGVLTHESGRFGADQADDLARTLGHRGPDDHGFLAWEPSGRLSLSRSPSGVGPSSVAFVHDRLSILDPSPLGWQPMASADRCHFLIFNGLIYNYVELRRELEALGHHLESSGDTAVLLGALVEWGESALSRLDGMFSLAFLDTGSGTVLLARDFAGMKPLYLARWEGGLAFASEMKALIGLPGVGHGADPQMLLDYLGNGLVDHGTRTMLADISQVAAGSSLLLRPGATEPPAPKSFWSLPESKEEAPLSAADAAERVRALFLRNVETHLRTDVPLGIALSGGIDSASILSSVRKLRPDGDIHVFGYVAEDEALSEERWIDLAAGAAEATLVKTKPGTADFWSDLDLLIRAQDQPFGSASVYAQYCVFRLAREHGMKVVLSGQGADEIFAGYPSYLVSLVRNLLRADRRREARRFVRRARVGRDDYLRVLVPSRIPRRAPTPTDAGYRANAWIDWDWFRSANAEPTTWAAPATSANPFYDRMRDAFVDRSLPHLLRYEDRNSMAFGIESRLPFLTPALVELAFSLPEHLLLDKRARTKAVLRDALGDILPAKIRGRRDKVGFVAPDARWLRARGGEVETIVQGGLAQMPFLDAQEALGLTRQALAGRFGDDSPVWRHIWRWVNLARWAELLDVRLG